MAGTLIREARKRAGLSQAALGHRLGVPGSAIGRWERGEVDPGFDSVLRTVRATGLDLTMALTSSDDHDVTLIRRTLSQTPQSRLEEMVTAVRALDRMAAASRG